MSIKKGFLALLLIVSAGSLAAQNNYLEFDGTDDYISISNNVSLNPTSAITLEAWIYTDDIAGQETPPFIKNLRK